MRFCTSPIWKGNEGEDMDHQHLIGKSVEFTEFYMEEIATGNWTGGVIVGVFQYEEEECAGIAVYVANPDTGELTDSIDLSHIRLYPASIQEICNQTRALAA